MEYKIPELFEKFKLEYYTKPLHTENLGKGRIYVTGSEGKKEGLVKRHHNVLVYKSEYGYTMSLLEHGGPIICNKDYDECKKIFMEAYKYMFVVMSMLSFPEAKKKMREEFKEKRKQLKNKNYGK